MPTSKEIFENLKAKVLAAISIVTGASTLVHGLHEQIAVLNAKNVALQVQLADAIAKLEEQNEGFDWTELKDLSDQLDASNKAAQELQDELALQAQDLAEAVAVVPEPAVEVVPEPAVEVVPEPAGTDS